MKLSSNSINNSPELVRHRKQNNGVFGVSIPKKSELAFTSGIDAGKVVQKASSTIQTLTKDQCIFIDKEIGNGFFAKTLQECGFDVNDALLTFKQPNLFIDLFKTLKYPFTDMWLDIAAYFNKNPKPGGIVSKYLQKTDLQKKQELLFNIAAQFNQNPDEKFAASVANNITQAVKNYRSRDERTLNRLLTASVSALYSSNDFFNISMLQKDDKSEAKKAQKARLKQELYRAGLSAGLTFISLGALDKHIKNNMYLSAFTIAGSALISEIVSRLLSKTPLAPLSSEKAKEIAEKKNNEIQKTKNNDQKTKQPESKQADAQNKTVVSFKAGVEKNIFKDFAKKDGTFAPVNIINNTENSQNVKTDSKPKENKKGKFGILNIAFAALAAVSLIEVLSKTSGGKVIGTKLKDIESFIKTKTITLSGKELQKFKDSVSELSSDKDIEKVIKEYSDALQGKTELEIKSNRFLISGFYDGLTRVFKTIYTILSAPAKGVMKLLNPKAEEGVVGVTDKSLGALYAILEENKGDKAKMIEEIKKRTRNFGQCVETGDLANFSRTLVTVLGSYFFVNDYRNKVLIESGGKDIEGANAEAKQRIGHKLANFIINGTIMNLGNSIFKGPLNSSLIAAGLIAIGEETTNEALVRKSTCQPILKKKSKQDIIQFEQKQLSKKGFMGAWTRLFMKLTGKKTLTQKAGIDKKPEEKNKEQKKA